MPTGSRTGSRSRPGRRPPQRDQAERKGPTTWLGGRFDLPFYIHEGEPYRPQVVLWLEAGGGFIRSLHLDRPPLGRKRIADTLREAIAAPTAGVPGEPAVLRVGDADLAAIARGVVGERVKVEVGPTPELEAAVRDLERAMAKGPPSAPGSGGRARGKAGKSPGARPRRARDDDGDPGYLQRGRIRPVVAAGLFTAAAELFVEAPWTRMSDSSVLAVDVPSYGISGGCLSVIGELDQDLGFVLFDSPGSYESFLTIAEQVAEDPERWADSPPPLRGYLFSLNFERWTDIDPSMRREVRKYGWKVAGPRGHPVLMCFDDDGIPRPAGERDFRLAAVCARSLARFCAPRDRTLDPPPSPPVTRRLLVEDDDREVEVRLTLPHPGAADFADLDGPPPLSTPTDRMDADRGFDRATPSSVPGAGSPVAGRPAELAVPAAARPAEPAVSRVGRNEPCPCGSGRKYKRCHGGLVASAADDGAAVDPGDEAGDVAQRWHERDRRLVREMIEFAKRRLADRWATVVASLGRWPEEDPDVQLSLPWLVFHANAGEHPVVDWFLRARSAYLAAADRAWLEAQRKAWVSVWEVLDVDPGRSVRLRDLLTGEERTAIERTASGILTRRDVVLGRIVRIESIDLMAGVHSRVLQPRSGDEVVRAVRRKLRLRTLTVAPERLRAGDAGRVLIREWERAVEERTRLAESAKVRMNLRNTDGHRLLLTEDRFRFDPDRRAEVVERLERFSSRELDPVADLDGERGRPRKIAGRADAGRAIRFTVSRPGTPRGAGLETVMYCSIEVKRRDLVVFANSLERADEARSRIDRECAGLVVHVARSHSDPKSKAHRARGGNPGIADSVDVPPPEALAAVVAFKRRHYEEWVDLPIPALDGLTPRTVASGGRGRRELDLLLREIENIEARSPAGQQFDVSILRRELGLDEDH